MKDTVAIVVGAGSSGLAVSACLNLNSISHIILEREDCFASLWKKYSYDRLRLHLRKQVCELPHMSFPESCPTYVPRDQFLKYLDDYVSHFKISPLYKRCVELASFDEERERWSVKAKNVSSANLEEYSARFLVVATGETCNPFVPEVEGLDSFTGEVLHSTMFKNGKNYRDKSVLVVGSGNSGMEIAFDLASHGARTSISVRSPIHILPREVVFFGAKLLKYFRLSMVDSFMVCISKLVYGDLSKYGIARPSEGPFFMKGAYGKYPVIDVGTVRKIKSGEIQVLPGVGSIRGDEVIFQNGKSFPFDTIIFCTGFTRSTNQWLKDDGCLLNNDGFTDRKQWKGIKGLYCVGLSRRGFYGASEEAKNIANDIKCLG